MISLTDRLYSELATKLLAELTETENMFNGGVEYDTEEFYSTLSCTLIIYRKKTADGVYDGEIENIVPVWWEFSIWAGGVEEENDFSWREFKNYLF